MILFIPFFLITWYDYDYDPLKFDNQNISKYMLALL